MTDIQQTLFSLQDLDYRDFTAKLIPTIDKERVIGVRSPAIQGLARALAKEPETWDFLSALPHSYQEENLLHAKLLFYIRDYDKCVQAVDAFLPYVDNWAVCDTLRPRCFDKKHARLIEDVRRWIDSDALYTRRFGLGMLMNHFLDADFRPEYLDWAASVESDEYYLRMMVAWYFATALAKQYEAALPYIEQRRLEPWTRNKAIQKAVESYRITDEQKAYLRTLKVKG